MVQFCTAAAVAAVVRVLAAVAKQVVRRRKSLVFG